MLPTIKIGETCVVDRYSQIEIKRCDIVMFKAPEEATNLTKETGDVKYISRIIALPNEKIEVRNSKVFINDKLLEEPFEKITDERDSRKDFSVMVIPENEYFIMGDNRPQSLDSRYWKTVKKEEILGKVVEILPVDVKK